jgi:TonB family protein
MKPFAIVLFILILLTALNPSVFSQSGRKQKVVKTPAPVTEAPSTNSNTAKPADSPSLTAEKNEDYRCTDDGTLARVVQSEPDTEQFFTSKNVDVRADIRTRPKPGYTDEARRLGVQGYVILRVELRSNGEIGKIRVLRGLPAGLTANAIRAACKMKFEPAVKDGKAVSQFAQVEYTFRLADSLISRPSRLQSRGAAKDM